jgi:hypothetical protein
MWLSFSGNQFQRDVRSWLSPPDPSTNHNIARRDHLKGTATWLTQSDRFKEWTETGCLFWIHGKRTRFFHFLLVAHTDAAWHNNTQRGLARVFCGKSFLKRFVWLIQTIIQLQHHSTS